VVNANAPYEPPSDDVLEHLWNAASEFLKAMRGLVDAAEEFVADQRSRTPADAPDARLQHIDIDD
jgi:hypothetical protein